MVPRAGPPGASRKRMTRLVAASQRRGRSSVGSTAQVRFTELSGRRAAIRERLETEWRRPLDDLLSTFVPVEMDDDALRAESESLRLDVERLGPVNPLAIEEHEEEQKRLEFLTGQRNDLAEARSKLQMAIREIDITARDLFMTTFGQVRET